MDPILILDQVNSFYSNAFSHLITYTLIVLGFGTVVLPIILQIIQSRYFHFEKESLETLMSENTNRAKEELKVEIDKYFQNKEEQFNAQFQNEVKKIDQQFFEQQSIAKSGIFFLQGSSGLDKKEYFPAANDFAVSCTHAINGKDTINALSALSNLIKALSHLDSSHFKEKSHIDEVLNKLIDKLKEYNEKDLITGRIYDLVTAIDNAKNRETPLKKQEVNF
jgi:hypothetical protein